MRPTWTEFYLGLAQAASVRGECTRSKVGAILVKVLPDGRHRTSIGYNGAEPGAPSCLTGHCPRGLMTYDEHPPRGSYSNCIAMHAEDNAITNASFDIHNAVVYVTREPCDDCHSLMDQMGIHASVWPDGMRDYAKSPTYLPPGWVRQKSPPREPTGLL